MRVGLLVGLLALPACDGRAQVGGARAGGPPRPVRELPALSNSAWSALVLSLSEEGGFFDTDNLISNERSYLEIVEPLRDLRGGAYIGVGPDQSFSYMAAARPAVAFIVDIRRDNLLQHLLLKALFALSANRAEYLARLHGRAPLGPGWETRPLEALLERIDGLEVDPASVCATRQAVDALLRALPLPLDDDDLATVERFHRTFIEQGTGLRFRTFGRAPRPFYPTFRDLLLGRDGSGALASYMAREEDFQRVKALEAKNLVVPVVGDLAGSHALRAIGDWLEKRGVGLSVLYTSNVEDYLWRGGDHGAFVANVRSLPWLPDGVLVRSYFGSARALGLPPRSGSYSTQIVQPASAFLEVAAEAGAGRVSYERLITAGALAPR